MQANNENCGWVLKAPFVTNSMHFLSFFSEPEDVLRKLELVSESMFQAMDCYVIPYLILQPRMQNRKEYKVVLLNGSVSHIAVVAGSHVGSKAYSKASHTRLFDFAEKALKVLKEVSPQTISDGLVRVDIFETQSVETFTDEFGKEGKRNRWVVNEFESLEAQFTGSAKNEACVYGFLHNYWKRKVSAAIEEVIA
jgi:hypothetical protein